MASPNIAERQMARVVVEDLGCPRCADEILAAVKDPLPNRPAGIVGIEQRAAAVNVRPLV